MQTLTPYCPMKRTFGALDYIVKLDKTMSFHPIFFMHLEKPDQFSLQTETSQKMDKFEDDFRRLK